MELDPRLQNISAADLQEFTVPHYPNFDQGYQSALYDNGLSEEHNAPAHAQAYAQFVADHNQQPHFEEPGTSPTRSRGNNVRVTRNQNVNSQPLSSSPIRTRQGRHIPQQPAPPQFNNHPFTSPTTSVPRNNHTPTTSHPNPISTSPLTQRNTSRTQQQLQLQQQHQQQQRQHQPTLTPTKVQSHQQPPPPPPPPPLPPQINSQSTEPLSDLSQFSHPSTFPLVPNPANLSTWREKFFNITEPLLLTSEEYHTYFPHVDNIYSHRSTQKYKKKPFVSHYWDCRLKGRPTGTPLSKLRRRQEGKEDEEDTAAAAAAAIAAAGDSGDKDVKKRKRKVRERDLCDVKIKVTEFFGRDELEALGKSGLLDGDEENGRPAGGGQLTFVLEDGTSTTAAPPAGAGHRMSVGQTDDAMSFGVLEPLKKLPEGHPGAEGKRWYMVQRVNGSGKDDNDVSLDHKHTMEESDRIKKNSVQRWLLAQEKERKKQSRTKTIHEADTNNTPRSASFASAPSFHASGKAQQTAKSHAPPASTQLTFYANSFCPFAQRIWIALELKGIPYQYVEVTPSQMKDGKCIIPGLTEVCPEGVIPLLRHGNWAVWESDVVLEYLEDLSMGHSLLPLGEPQLRAHSRLWKDHINRKVLPYFYALLILPMEGGVQSDSDTTKPSVAERQLLLITALQKHITELVNASHATGPFFLGSEMSLVDVTFAPWIIRLSRVLEYYREFPKPEVGTRWKAWVDAVENNDAVRRTVSEDKSYHAVYGGIGKDISVLDKSSSRGRGISEMRYAQKLVRQEGFGLGGDVWGTLLDSENQAGVRR